LNFTLIFGGFYKKKFHTIISPLLCEGLMLFVTCRWRIHIRKALSPTQKPDPTTKEQTGNEQKVDEEDRLLNEMEELTNVMDRKKKRAKKLLAKRRAKVLFVALNFH